MIALKGGQCSNKGCLDQVPHSIAPYGPHYFQDIGTITQRMICRRPELGQCLDRDPVHTLTQLAHEGVGKRPMRLLCQQHTPQGHAEISYTTANDITDISPKDSCLTSCSGATMRSS